MSAQQVVVVGGGVLGTLHAWEAVARGFTVVHLERDLDARGASVRNLGLVWVSGRASGRELDLALRARHRWEEIADQCPGIGFRANGSLTVAADDAGATALALAAKLPDADARGFALLDPDEARRHCPELGPAVTAALWCERDGSVEPRSLVRALRSQLASSKRYRWIPGRQVVSASRGQVRDHTGEVHAGDVVVVCPGADHMGLGSTALGALALRRVHLQVFQTAPLHHPLGPTLADTSTLRYYPAFVGPARESLGPQHAANAQWKSQLLVSQRADGSLTIGDTHSYEEPFGFDYDGEPEEHLLDAASRILGIEIPPVRRRWTGTYSEYRGEDLYARVQAAPGMVVVTGAGGRGVTLAPAIAQETFS